MAELPEPAVMCDCGGDYYTADQLRAAIQAALDQKVDEMNAAVVNGDLPIECEDAVDWLARAFRGQAEGRE